MDECRLNNGGCEQDCTNIPGGHYCSCRSGYYISDNLSDCIDVNECEDGDNGGCDHICENSPGSFSCSCRNGFLKINSTHCEGLRCFSYCLNNEHSRANFNLSSIWLFYLITLPSKES